VTTLIRESLGRYRVEAEIGRGAMGVVYRARDPKIDRLVAIKTISLLGKDGSEEQEYRDRFVQEARAAGKLAHPGIVTVFDAGEDPETHEPFLVMEYVAGQPLSDTIAASGGRLPLTKGLQLTCQVADALQYAHSQGVIHGDIKPANILITEEGRAKIADFGVARLNHSIATHAGKIFGSPAYMAPEQLGGAEPDARSDLFSLGVILYSMLTGFRPFQGNSAQTVCFKVLNVDPLPVSSLRADLPPGLDRIVQRAIAKDARDRYQSGAELAADIRAFASNDDSFAEATRFFTRVLEQKSPSAEQHYTRAVLTRRSAMQAAGAVVFIAVLFTAVELTQSYRAAATLLPPQPVMREAPAIQKTPRELQPIPASNRHATNRAKSVPRAERPRAEAANIRVEILHHFASGKASVWVDQQLVLEQELHARGGHRGFFRVVEMNQTSNLRLPSGKHQLMIRVISPGTYDQSESLAANLTAGPEHVLYVSCDKHKLQVKLQ
jgi:eukaryotic-like serine/threonine-protein kinase